MRRMLGFGLLLGIVFFIMGSQPVAATPIITTFGDTQKYWPGWGNTDHDSSPGWDNNLDTIGDTNFTGGSVTLSEDYALTQIVFNLTWIYRTVFGKVEPGNLFLSTDSDTNWDYVIYADNNQNKLDGNVPSPINYRVFH